MRSDRPKRTILSVESCEDRTLTALVFVLNGASFDAAGPNDLTNMAAAVLRRAGHQVVQLANGRIDTAAAFHALEARVVRLARGQTVGLVGFSAGGALALRLAATPGLAVSSVLNYYGVPDVQAYLQRHRGDRNFRPIAGLAPFRPSVVALLSGPVATRAHVVAAFGQLDPNVRADTSAADLRRDVPTAVIHVYPGGHGVSITASRPALEDFLAHLG